MNRPPVSTRSARRDADQTGLALPRIAERGFGRRRLHAVPRGGAGPFGLPTPHGIRRLPAALARAGARVVGGRSRRLSGAFVASRAGWVTGSVHVPRRPERPPPPNTSLRRSPNRLEPFGMVGARTRGSSDRGIDRPFEARSMPSRRGSGGGCATLRVCQQAQATVTRRDLHAVRALPFTATSTSRHRPALDGPVDAQHTSQDIVRAPTMPNGSRRLGDRRREVLGGGGRSGRRRTWTEPVTQPSRDATKAPDSRRERQQHPRAPARASAAGNTRPRRHPLASTKELWVIASR